MKTRTLRGVIQCLIAVAILLSLTGCLVVNRAAPHLSIIKGRLDPFVPNHTINGRGWTNSVGEGTNTITVLHLDVTNHYSQGYWHGRLLAPQIKGTIDDLYIGADKLITKMKLYKNSMIFRWVMTKPVRRSLVNHLLDRSWKIMEPYVPQADLDEMQGLADGLKAAGYSKIDLKTIHHVHAFPDVTETSCSQLFACSTGTLDGHVYQLRVLDYGAGSGLEKRPLITVYHPTRHYENPFIAIGWIGFVGLVTGVNEKGVCISEMGFGNPPGETLAGEPMVFLLKRALRFGDNVEAVLAIIRSARRNNSYAYLVGDKTGKAVDMFTSAQECRMFPINECKVIEGTVKGKPVTLPQFTDVLYAGHKKEEQTPLVQKLLGRFNVVTVQKHAKDIAMKSNLHIAIFDLTTGDTYVANRHGKVSGGDCEYVLFPKSAWEK